MGVNLKMKLKDISKKIGEIDTDDIETGSRRLANTATNVLINIGLPLVFVVVVIMIIVKLI